MPTLRPPGRSRPSSHNQRAMTDASVPSNAGSRPDQGLVALDRLCRPRRNHGRRHPRLNPIDPKDLALFRAVLAGEHAIVGFRNTHIPRRLWRNPPADEVEAKRRCAYVSRQIAKLRGHGLIAKVPRHRLYRPTPYGQRAMSAAIAVHDRAFLSPTPRREETDWPQLLLAPPAAPSSFSRTTRILGGIA